MPWLDEAGLAPLYDNAMGLLHGEMARLHARWFAQYEARYRPRTARGIRRGQAVEDATLAALRQEGLLVRARIETLMKEAEIDLWVTPASAGPAPEGYEITGWGGMTTPWSYAGLPCVTVPAGRAANGLPVGLQAIAPFMADEALFEWAEGLAYSVSS